jgi:hypothetical protein
MEPRGLVLETAPESQYCGQELAIACAWGKWAVMADKAAKAANEVKR